MAKFSQTRCGIPYRLRVSGSQWHIPPYPNIPKVPSLGSSLTYISNTCPLSTLSSTSANALTCNGEWGRAACTHGRPNSERKLLTTATTNKSQWYALPFFNLKGASIWSWLASFYNLFHPSCWRLFSACKYKTLLLSTTALLVLQQLLVGAWLKDLVNLHSFGRPLSLREVDLLRDFKADLTKIKGSLRMAECCSGGWVERSFN